MCGRELNPASLWKKAVMGYGTDFKETKRPIHGGHTCNDSHARLILQLCSFFPRKHQHYIICKQCKKYISPPLSHRDISILFLHPNEAVFVKTSVYAHTDEGKSQFACILNNANRRDKNGALKSATDKQEAGGVTRGSL